MKSSSGHIIINNINKNKDAKENKDNNTNTIHLSTRKSSNNLRMNINNQNKYGSIQTNRIFLKKHIVIESKNKNNGNDTGKNNNSVNSSNNNKNNNEGNNNNMNYNYMGNNNGNGINCHNSINLKIKDRNNNFKDYNQISNYQNIFNGVKYKSKNLVLGEILNNNDF